MKILANIEKLTEIRFLRLSKLREYIEISIFSLIALSIPILIGHPQLVVGSIVNFMIVRSSLSTKKWKNLPIILLPSIGVLLRGVLFGTFTKFLIVIIPFIWAGNLVLSLLTKNLLIIKGKNSRIIAIVLIPFVKTLIIFIPVLLLVKLEILPKPFVESMGMVQLYTASLGLLAGLFSIQIENYFRTKVAK